MSGTPSADNFSPVFVQATLLMLQTIYLDVEDLMGSKQGNAFQRDITALFQKAKLAGTGTPDAIQQLLTADPLNSLQPPPWREAQVISLLQEIHRLGRSYFGNSGFTRNVLESLQDLSTGDRTAFNEWLARSPVGSLWK